MTRSPLTTSPPGLTRLTLTPGLVATQGMITSESGTAVTSTRESGARLVSWALLTHTWTEASDTGSSMSRMSLLMIEQLKRKC